MSNQTLFLLKTLKNNSIVKFFGSVKLAVVTMLSLTGIVAWGTVLESRFNSDYAKTVVYQSKWFLIILVLLFVNILVATLLRIPFRKHHTGFVITHLGLLTLLAGSMVTSVAGIDGSMRIAENQTSANVVLPELVLEVTENGQRTGIQIPVDKSVFRQGVEKFAQINRALNGQVRILESLPFVEVQQGIKSDPASSNERAIQFQIQSQFFNTQETLALKSRNHLSLGPAEFSLKSLQANATKKSAASPAIKVAPKKIAKKTKSTQKVFVVDAKTGDVLVETAKAQFIKNGVSVRDFKIQVAKTFEHASVGSQGIEEKSDGPLNRAYEIKLTQNQTTYRDILFEKFPQFSLHPEGIGGLKIKIEGSEEETSEPTMPKSSSVGEPPNDQTHAGVAGEKRGLAKNQVNFEILPDEQIQLRLEKEGKEVLKKILKQGEEVVTPWMGMKVTLLNDVKNAVAVENIKEVEPLPKRELPPSAVLVEVTKGFPPLPFYLVEGDSRQARIGDKDVTLYYGRKVIELPFQIHLDQFKKTDYPGTQTPMEFESLVTLQPTRTQHRISMNEPLKKDEFTFYQASFEESPQVATILSVNHDPGRWIKYIGSLITGLGIIIYTLMRSRIAREKTA